MTIQMNASPPPAPPVHVEGLSAVAGRYDGLIVDLWGVLHDGHAPYPGAVDCLAALRREGKSVCLLSNAPRRIDSVARRLAEIGIPADAYDHLMTSGEATHEAFLSPPDDFHAALGDRCLHIGPPRDDDVHEGVGLTMVDRAQDATFVLCTGIDDNSETVEDYAAALAEAAAHDLPMVCANPDLVVMIGTRKVICAATLAAHYESLGGRVAYHGKPHAPVYRRCFDLLGISDRSRILGVGDSLRTDVAGANAAGIDSLLLLGGIHAEEFAAAPGDGPALDRIAEAGRAENAHPTWVGPAFIW
ncbi:TIGR01459 family HAD-type hydrolase [Inquilinus sp. CAU 1745]|uniref:TIGR01459 family HAD-type hydrolase n=1 Tax=Inquilinus sp. CAU 1745 TaxID=3140369 RepID=UPI00325BB31D